MPLSKSGFFFVFKVTFLTKKNLTGFYGSVGSVESICKQASNELPGVCSGVLFGVFRYWRIVFLLFRCKSGPVNLSNFFVKTQVSLTLEAYHSDWQPLLHYRSSFT